MSERYVYLTKFCSTSINTTQIRMTEFEDTGDQSISRLLTLPNGTKIDMDGTGISDTTLGTVISTFRVKANTKGTTQAGVYYSVLTGLRGKHGTLRGYTIDFDGSTSGKTCSARLMIVRGRRVRVGQDSPMAATHRFVQYVDCVWERKTAWS